jgi:hypothetical protein
MKYHCMKLGKSVNFRNWNQAIKALKCNGCSNFPRYCKGAAVVLEPAPAAEQLTLGLEEKS